MTTIRVALISAWILAAFIGPADAAPGSGQPAPRLVVPEIDGARFDLAALRGKVVIINFWATWCPPCRQEMPALDAFYSRFRARGVELIGISVDHGRDRKSVAKAAQEVHYPVAMLADAETNGFGRPGALPVTYIVDQAGNLRSVMTPDTSAVSESALERIVTPLLPGDHPSP
jgi:cytochrome c biogenesis protein CcmG, thiol:disulfide interchange protein DsbE